MRHMTGFLQLVRRPAAAKISRASLSRVRGEVNMRSRSRDAFAPEFCESHSQRARPQRHRVTPQVFGGTAFGSITIGTDEKEKRKKEA
jgi:hypothetical protein